MLECIRGEKDIHLTPRQKEVLYYVALGYKNNEISEILCITEHTVKAHICAIYESFGVNSRVQIVIFGIKNGILDLDKI